MRYRLGLLRTCAASPGHWFSHLQWTSLALILALLAGCASPQRTPPQEALSERTFWSGRLALQVEGQAAQSFSSAFELQGNAERGELSLFSPLGSVLAQLQWAPGLAKLQNSGHTSTSDSLDALLIQATGTAIPAQALFSWLRGLEATVPGWQADLHAIDQGRLVATRHAPTPQAILRIAFER